MSHGGRRRGNTPLLTPRSETRPRTWRHRLTEINEEQRTATCAQCGPDTEVQRYTSKRRLKDGTPRLYQHWICAEANREYNRWYDTGWTGEEYKAAVDKQNGLCASCGRGPTERGLVADHCHQTGERRELLCEPCNQMLGCAGDDPERLRAGAAYLERHRR